MAHAHHHHGDGAHPHHHAVPSSAADFSLLRTSAVQRLMLAAVPVAALWALVWWAMR